MTNEIKEIIEDVKRHLDYVEATKQSSIRDNEMKAMYDYITNLQEENERLNNIIKEVREYLKDNEREYGSLEDNEKIILEIIDKGSE